MILTVAIHLQILNRYPTHSGSGILKLGIDPGHLSSPLALPRLSCSLLPYLRAPLPLRLSHQTPPVWGRGWPNVSTRTHSYLQRRQLRGSDRPQARNVGKEAEGWGSEVEELGKGVREPACGIEDGKGRRKSRRLRRERRAGYEI